jgi:hypothetical protein
LPNAVRRHRVSPSVRAARRDHDGVIIDVQNSGTPDQAMAFTKVKGVTPGNAGLDDVIKPSATAGTFYLTDTQDNRVLSFHVTGLNVNDYYASLGNAFGQIDPTTGAFTPLVSAADAPGFTFGSPHGASFVPDSSADVALFAHFMAGSMTASSQAGPLLAVAPQHSSIDQVFLSHPNY